MLYIYIHIGIDGRCSTRRKMPRASDNPRAREVSSAPAVFVVASSRACVKYPRRTPCETSIRAIRSETLRDHARAERRFGVEREPVVTYARARACVSALVNAPSPATSGQRPACEEQPITASARARGRGVVVLRRPPSDGFFKELPPRLFHLR